MSSQNLPNWPYNHCLTGVAGRQSASFEDADYRAIATAHLEAVLISSVAAPECIDNLRNINPNVFFLVELADRGRSPDYVSSVENGLAAYYFRGVRHFLISDSIFIFEQTFNSICERLKSKFPEALIGFPELRIDSIDDTTYVQQQQSRLEQSAEIINVADWIGVSCFWKDEESRNNLLGGQRYREYLERYPNKQLFITSFGNLNGSTPSSVKAHEYINFYNQVQPIPAIGAAFAFALSGSGLSPNTAWRLEDGTLTDIPKIIGSRPMAANDDPADHNEPDEAIKQSAAPRKRQTQAAPTPQASADDKSEPDSADLPPLELVTRHLVINDQPFGADRLKYDDYAKAFAQVLTSDETSTPLTIGIYGSWGMGKSFLMRRIRELITDRLKDPSFKPKYDFLAIEFNAWVYSGSENLWAGLITHLYNEVEKYLGQRRIFWQRLIKQLRKQIGERWQLAVTIFLATLPLAFLLNYSDILSQLETIRALIITGVSLTIIGPLYAVLRELVATLIFTRADQLAAFASRKNFRDKIGFMADIKSEIGEIHELLEGGKTKGRPVRVMITIDDLDRCPPEKAVEVLEAIMLLLADKDGSPFIVLLGIDARIIVKAVEAKYGRVLTEAGISGYEYLDKIVQIPFRIPRANATARQNFVKKLLANLEPTHKDQINEPPQSPANKREEAKPHQPPAANAPHHSPGVQLNAPMPPPDQTPFQPVTLPEQLKIEVTFTQVEQNAFATAAKYLSPNPRRIKRIVNIYRLARLLVPNLSNENRTLLIKWVILSEQWPFRISWLLEEIENDDQRAVENKTNRRFADNDNLVKVLKAIKPKLTATAMWHVLLDDDPDLLEPFMQSQPIITVHDVRDLQPLAFNLNPAMQVEVLRANATTAPEETIPEEETEK